MFLKSCVCRCDSNKSSSHFKHKAPASEQTAERQFRPPGSWPGTCHVCYQEVAPGPAGESRCLHIRMLQLTVVLLTEEPTLNPEPRNPGLWASPQCPELVQVDPDKTHPPRVLSSPHKHCCIQNGVCSRGLQGRWRS